MSASPAADVKDVETLLEKQAVVEDVTRLFVSTDARDWTGVAACLAREVLFDMSSLGAGPPARKAASAIVEGWEAGLRSIPHVHHQVGNFFVSIDGPRASVFCYGIALHHLPNPAGSTRTFVGSYDMGLEKTDSGWRIDAFRFHLKYIDGNPNLVAAHSR